MPQSGYILRKEDTQDMKPQKLFNYVLQNLETSTNVLILWEILKLLRGKKTRLVLYTYDAFLFDLDKESKKRHWILEMYFIDRVHGIGGFYEQLLT